MVLCEFLEPAFSVVHGFGAVGSERFYFHVANPGRFQLYMVWVPGVRCAWLGFQMVLDLLRLCSAVYNCFHIRGVSGLMVESLYTFFSLEAFCNFHVEVVVKGRKDRGIDKTLVSLYIDRRQKCQVSLGRLQSMDKSINDFQPIATESMCAVAKTYCKGSLQVKELFQNLDIELKKRNCRRVDQCYIIDGILVWNKTLQAQL